MDDEQGIEQTDYEVETTDIAPIEDEQSSGKGLAFAIGLGAGGLAATGIAAVIHFAKSRLSKEDRKYAKEEKAAVDNFRAQWRQEHPKAVEVEAEVIDEK